MNATTDKSTPIRQKIVVFRQDRNQHAKQIRVEQNSCDWEDVEEEEGEEKIIQHKKQQTFNAYNK